MSIQLPDFPLFGPEAAIAAVVILLALLVDRIAGDPQSSCHPVALLGRLIGWWGRPDHFQTPHFQLLAGIAGWLVTAGLLVVPSLLYSLWVPWWGALIFTPVLLKVCIGWRSLEEHVSAVERTVERDIIQARKEAGMIVSRDTSALSPEQLLSAAYESGAENITDSITAPIFWFAILGLPGAMLYRSANTMDAMLGYRDERKFIGWFSARMDDLLTFVPARITGVALWIYFFSKGRSGEAIKILFRDGKKRPGWNGGIPMAMIAGGTGVCLEKPGFYRIGDRTRPLRDAGKDILAAIRAGALIFTVLVVMSLLLWQGLTNI